MATDSTRAAFLKVIGRSRVDQALVDSQAANRFSYATEAGERVPGLIMRPRQATGLTPVVIALHGTGGSKNSMLPLMAQLTERGCVAVAIDGRHHGERAGGRHGSEAYQDAILRTWQTGKGRPFLYDTVWDVLRLLDVLSQFEGVDATRAGLIGISKGGMEGYLAAAVDERIKAVVPCISAQSFRWAIEHDSWQARVSTFQRAFTAAAREAGVQPDAEFLRRFYDRVAPGIYSDFDGPEMLPLIAPRALYTINGELDPRCPLPGLQQCLEKTTSAYAKAPDRFLHLIQPHTGHAVQPAVLTGAVEWISHFL